MGQAMQYLELALLDHSLGATVWTPPSTLYWLASTDPFDPTLDGSSAIEPSGGGYVRPSCANNTTTWAMATGANPASKSNLIQIPFATATADWGTILAVYAGDASSAGNLLYGTAVPGGGVPILTGSQLKVAIGAFVVRAT